MRDYDIVYIFVGDFLLFGVVLLPKILQFFCLIYLVSVKNICQTGLANIAKGAYLQVTHLYVYTGKFFVRVTAVDELLRERYETRMKGNG